MLFAKIRFAHKPVSVVIYNYIDRLFWRTLLRRRRPTLKVEEKWYVLRSSNVLTEFFNHVPCWNRCIAWRNIYPEPFCAIVNPRWLGGDQNLICRSIYTVSCRQNCKIARVMQFKCGISWSRKDEMNNFGARIDVSSGVGPERVTTGYPFWTNNWIPLLRQVQHRNWCLHLKIACIHITKVLFLLQVGACTLSLHFNYRYFLPY